MPHAESRMIHQILQYFWGAATSGQFARCVQMHPDEPTTLNPAKTFAGEPSNAGIDRSFAGLGGGAGYGA